MGSTIYVGAGNCSRAHRLLLTVGFFTIAGGILASYSCADRGVLLPHTASTASVSTFWTPYSASCSALARVVPLLLLAPPRDNSSGRIEETSSAILSCE